MKTSQFYAIMAKLTLICAFTAPGLNVTFGVWAAIYFIAAVHAIFTEL